MEKRLIFTFTTGRSGTALLAQLLSLLPTDLVLATHEQKPLFDDYLWQARQEPSIFKSFWVDRKLPEIAKVPQPIYIETSHVACKGFLQSLSDLGVGFDTILLTRPLREVATSMYLLNDIPGRTKTGCRYYLLPDDPDNLVGVVNWKKLSDYQLCYWYCLEIYYRGLKFKLRNLDAFSISLSELKQEGGFVAMLNHLKLPPLTSLEEYHKLKNIYINQKQIRKCILRMKTPIDYDKEEEIVSDHCIFPNLLYMGV